MTRGEFGEFAPTAQETLTYFQIITKTKAHDTHYPCCVFVSFFSSFVEELTNATLQIKTNLSLSQEDRAYAC